MTFEEILPHLRSGQQVWRTSWYVSWCCLQQHLWFDHVGTNHPVMQSLFSSGNITAEDLNATDWELFPGSDETHSQSQKAENPCA